MSPAVAIEHMVEQKTVDPSPFFLRFSLVLDEIRLSLSSTETENKLALAASLSRFVQHLQLVLVSHWSAHHRSTDSHFDILHVRTTRGAKCWARSS